ncbi:probable methyltransferase-like protein 25 isoform X1 [Ostrinia nubilalis]|uniref:probable methyltransferase-like protein 25 isoform X1 n=1 Tax=Ostrinia nubilalis TaxID=29057 RepID=UPI0030824872
MKGSHSEESKETMSKVRRHLDSIVTFLNPLLPLANCHMVEFFTQNHWETLIPGNLKSSLDALSLNDAVNYFWSLAKGQYINDHSELGKWIEEAKSNCVTVNNEYCISAEQLHTHIQSLGGDIKPEIKVKEFMNNKKSYEVQTMSRLVASLYEACSASCCVEAGGGRGHLPVALTLGYGIPSLTIDCDEKTLTSAAERIKIIQKQWHAIAKKIKDGQEEKMSKESNRNLHRFATAYVTRHTDLRAIVKEKFPEMEQEDVKLLLTGLHTCGNLGPASLRIFTSQPSTAAVFNVPCCYHLLAKDIDSGLCYVFQKGCVKRWLLEAISQFLCPI